MYTGLKIQNDFYDDFQDMILSEDHELVKLKKIIEWQKIDKIYKKCYYRWLSIIINHNS